MKYLNLIHKKLEGFSSVPSISICVTLSFVTTYRKGKNWVGRDTAEKVFLDFPQHRVEIIHQKTGRNELAKKPHELID
jgi:hypothetical protein